MAAMTTALTEFSNNGNSRTSTLAGHSVSKPQLVIERRRVPVGNQVVAESVISVIYATTDPAGAVLPQKVTFETVIRQPVNGQGADVTAALAILRDIVAGDEFANTVSTQEWLS